MGKLYSSLKFFGFPEHLEAVRRQELLPPVQVRVKPINHCNHDCWYCAYRVSNLKLGAEMDERDTIPGAKMAEIVEDFIGMGVKAVTFSGGGEPTLYKPLPASIERLAEGGLKIGCLTNGSNLKGRVAEAFAAHGTWVRVSLDGYDGPSYAQARRVPEDTFGKLLANLRDFAARGSTCVLGAAYIIDQSNWAHTADICRILKEIGLNHVKLSGVIVGNDAAENNAYHDGIQKAVREEIEKAKELADGRFAIIDHYHSLAERFDKPYTICPNIQFTPVIGADCMVYSCHDKAYTRSGALGSIAERSFREFWLSEENQARVYGIDPSRDCRHHCMDHVKNLTILDYLAIDPDHAMFA